MVVKKIKENIYMFKEIDWDLKDFHGSIYPLDNGTSYSCYLVIDDEITLIDTIDDDYSDYLIAKLELVLDGRNIDNIIINHVEPDHAGGFHKIYNLYPNAKVYTSISGKKAMQNHFFMDVEYNAVKTLSEIKTGKYTFQFVLTPLVHWPDNMVTYLKEEKVLFSNDAFGQHITSNFVYASECNMNLVLESAKEYYANIVFPYGDKVQKALSVVESIDIDYILPAHGVAYKDCIKDILAAYKSWCSYEVTKKAVIVYDSLWGNTKELSLAIGETLSEIGYNVKRYQLSKMRISTIMKDIMDCELIIIGSGNYNGTMIPKVADFIERLYGAKLKNKKGFAFGSYGWEKSFINRLEKGMKEANIELIPIDMFVNYVPTDDDKDVIRKRINDLFK